MYSVRFTIIHVNGYWVLGIVVTTTAKPKARQDHINYLKCRMQ